MQTIAHTPKPPVAVHTELRMTHRWDTSQIRSLIESKTAAGSTPAFLFLGRREAELLREHLGAGFGPESVRTLRNLYYMGLEVIELDTASFLRTAGLKRVREIRDRRRRLPRWRDVAPGSFWQFEAA